MLQRTFVEVGGWVGVAAILGAYAGVSFSWLEPTDVAYPTLNASGAVLVTLDALGQRNWQPAVLNVVWALVALVSMARLLLQ